MKIQVHRTKKTDLSITGRMSLDGVFEAYTLENVQLAAPLGEFELQLYLSPRLGYEVLLLMDVPNRSMIEIHIGNKPADFHGCIGVGTSLAPDWISNSHEAFQRLINKVKPLLVTGEQVFISIEEAYAN